jgi:transcription elongation factor GreA
MTEYLTAEGLEKLKKELEFLKNVKRREIAESLQRSAEYGDLSENSEYLGAKEAQGFVEGRILELEDIIRSAVIVKEGICKKVAQIGSTILVSMDWQSKNPLKKEKQQFKIVGGGEANPLEGKISSESPIGKAILNKPKNSIITVETPQGKIKYKLLDIE